MTSEQVKARARELGFDLCGIARARKLDPARFDRWTSNGWDAKLSYVRERRAERLDPSLLVNGALSVIVVAASYAPGPQDPEPITGELSIARYARGRDYHNVILKPARKLAAWLRSFGAQVYCEVDTGAVLEKAWAQEAGIGWIGKNGCLINERLGSWLLLGALVTDAGLDPDEPHPDRCGECALCIPACPTDAIPEPRYVDARRCIAYHTIEHRDPIPPELAARFEGRLFGCAACQDVCPWNRRAPIRRAPNSSTEGMLARPQMVNPALEWLAGMDAAEFKRWFKGSPVERTRRKRLLRNVAIAMGNSGDQRFATQLEAWALAEDLVLAEAAQWAL